MRRGRVDSLRTVIICIILALLTFDGMALINIQRDLKTLAEASSVNSELTLQNRQLINHLAALDKAQNDAFGVGP